MTEIRPQARQDELVIQEVFDELVVYDLKRDRVHTLNPTAAFVWQHCNGETSISELASRLQGQFNTNQADDLLWLSLDRLEKAHLLDAKVTQPNGPSITRRQALRTLGIAMGLLPVIVSIVAPTAAQAGNSDCDRVVETTQKYDSDRMCTSACRDAGYASGYKIWSSERRKTMACCCKN